MIFAHLVVLYANSLIRIDLYPPHVKAASQSAYSGKVFQDELPDGVRAIGTHSGAFHSDEALAISLLRSLAASREYGAFSCFLLS